ncbi:hypothetical protein J45TS6_08330 [Paenibacillus sp. J45TS6]|nr:hypothetical protein J45TS6_08330 [Paenibacillus sp. J45TS6]
MLKKKSIPNSSFIKIIPSNFYFSIENSFYITGYLLYVLVIEIECLGTYENYESS